MSRPGAAGPDVDRQSHVDEPERFVEVPGDFIGALLSGRAKAARPARDAPRSVRRPNDWLRQARLDLETAALMRERERFEWACFSAQQAADKAVKALHDSAGTEAWGHAVAGLLEGLDGVPPQVMEAGKRLDKHYLPTRYPNTHPRGAPGDLYTADEADRALEDAATVVEHVEGRLPPA